jgi:[acyl-carrier-protein] S-malonyltransferase
MNDAVEPMLKKINEYQFKNPEVNFYSNYSGNRINESHEMKDFLVKQVNSPVRWTKIIENIMSDSGEDVEFLEVGPGKVLQGLLKRINRKIKVGGVSSPTDIENLVKE